MKDYYDNVVSLGYNCEVAYRIKDSFDLPSYPFSWVYIYDLKRFSELLYNLDDVFNSESEIFPWGMILYKKYQISFHIVGDAEKPLLFLENGELNKEFTDQKLIDLKSRYFHMVDKFKNLLKSHKKTLFVIKLKDDQALKDFPLVYNFFKQNYQIGRGGKFKILIVMEEKYKSRNNIKVIKKCKNAVIKYITNFADDGDTLYGGDHIGWQTAFKSLVKTSKKN